MSATADYKAKDGKIYGSELGMTCNKSGRQVYVWGRFRLSPIGGSSRIDLLPGHYLTKAGAIMAAKKVGCVVSEV